MADRTSARLFGEIFNHIAKNPTNENISFGKWLSQLTKEYDFSTYQMYCDESLVKLGLAREATEQEKVDEIVDTDDEFYIYLF